MNKNLIITISTVLIILVGWFYFTSLEPESDTTPENTGLATEQSSENDEFEMMNENEVIYTDGGFNPSSMNIEVGSTVTFINESSRPMWVGSDPHPAHTDYPDFDQLGDGEIYSYTFNEPGAYGYHNHMVPTHSGIITVE